MWVGFPIFLCSPVATNLALLTLYLCTDSLNAFKTAFLTQIGYYLLSVLELFYKDARPFWNNAQIKSYNMCLFNFGSPSQTTFILSFMYSYTLLMYRVKYTEPGKQNSVLIITLCLLTAWAYFAGLAFGVNYLYQSFVGSVIGFCYLILTLAFDREIHRLCEKAGFLLFNSRKSKFTIFLFIVSLWVFISIAFLAIKLGYYVPPEWLYNSVHLEPYCKRQFPQHASYAIGTDFSYCTSGQLFYILGMVFGQSLSIHYVYPLQWINASNGKKAVRAVIGLLLVISFFAMIYLPDAFLQNGDMATLYIWYYVMPAGAMSFVIYGLFPIMCKYFKLF